VAGGEGGSGAGARSVTAARGGAMRWSSDARGRGGVPPISLLLPSSSLRQRPPKSVAPTPPSLPSSLGNLFSPSSGHHPAGIAPPTSSQCCRHRAEFELMWSARSSHPPPQPTQGSNPGDTLLLFRPFPHGNHRRTRPDLLGPPQITPPLGQISTVKRRSPHLTNPRTEKVVADGVH